MKLSKAFVMLVVLCMLAPVVVYGQGASTGAVTGIVTDPKGASVPNAKVELLDTATGITTSGLTGADGGYLFPAVVPGTYKITVTAKGFRVTVINNAKVEVGKSALVNVALDLGQVTEIVEVTAGAGVELQTVNASVGNVLDSNMLANLPTLSRDATALLLVQPLTIPGFNGQGTTGEGNLAGGGVAGALPDQNTFMIDGGDATSNMEGAGGYNSGFVATPRAVVPTPVESLEEFRVLTNNAGTEFTRSSGAEVQMVTRRGSNDWHGAGYWYHQNDELNANSWKRNNTIDFLTKKTEINPELRDNRYGGRIGGPIWKNRTFFFLHEEERHFFRADDFTRLVPTAAMRAGVIEVCTANCKPLSSSSTIVGFNLTPQAVVNPGAFPGDPLAGQTIQPSGLDPRASTLPYATTCTPPHCINPAIDAEWGKLPLANDFSQGDGLRTAGFSEPAPETNNEHFAVARVDHKINDKWDAMVSYRYSVTDETPSTWQVDISGTARGCTFGVPCPLAKHPLQPRFLVTGLTGRITPNLINEFHFNWLRHWWAWSNTGTGQAVISSAFLDPTARLQIWRESGSNFGVNGLVPINVDTQHGRQRTWNGKDFTWNDNLSWVKGKHVWSFGGRAQVQHLLHIRDDKVVGGMTTPIYYVAHGGDFTNVGSIPNPSGLGSTTWDRAYLSILGIVDSANQVLTRDKNFNPQQRGTKIFQNENVDSYELSFSDTWRVKPSLTASYGLTWGVQMPPYDTVGRTTMMVDVNSGQIIDAASLLNAKKLAGLNGDVVNPEIGYVPIRATGRKYPYDPDYSNFGPRLALAWNPSMSDGLMGKFLGNKKSVIRAGWARSFDRLNGVGLVLTPALGAGFGALSICAAPSIAGTCGAGGTPSNNFRIGVDGTSLTPPALAPVSGVLIPGQLAPLAPGDANSVYESRDFRIDPKRRVGRTDTVDLSIQRELPGQMLLEVGYVGRLSRNLVQNIDLNHIPYMFTPKGVNQSYAQAFDAVAGEILAGNPITNQPWFEFMLGPGGTAAAVANEGSGAFASHAAGLVWFDLEPSFLTGPMTAFKTQMKSFDWTTSGGYSNYHAGFITLRKRPTHGLSFDFNYTLSHSLDTLGLTQENTCAVTDAYFIARNYEPSLFDRRHTFNLLMTYELPLGKGKAFAKGELADRVLGGWSVSGVYTAASGLPNMLWDECGCGTEFGSTPFNGDDIGLIPLKSGVINTSVHAPTALNTPPNALANPGAASANLPGSFGFRYETFADNRTGFGAIRGLWRWNMDIGIAKRTRITERVSTRFDVQFVNAFNHPLLSGVSIFGPGTFFSTDANFDLNDSPSRFGALPNQMNSPRFIQLGLRFDF